MLHCLSYNLLYRLMSEVFIVYFGYSHCQDIIGFQTITGYGTFRKVVCKDGEIDAI